MEINTMSAANTAAGRDSNYQICSKCLLDTSELAITFDADGVCHYCRHYEAHTRTAALTDAEKQRKLEALVAEIKLAGKGKKYDCIIGLSGGLDSSYVAWITKSLGLRPIAVHFDNGWNSELAVSNIEKLCQKANIDLYTYVVDWLEFRDLQISFLKAGVSNAEAPTDHGIFASLFQLSQKFDTKYIVDGVNSATEILRPGMYSAGWAYADLKHLKGIHKKFGTIPLKTFPTLSLFRKVWLQSVIGIRRIHILDLVDYSKKTARQLLEVEFGWRSYSGKHHESTFTKWHQVVYLPQRFGFDKRRLHLSDLVITGQMSRQEALEELSRPAIPYEEQRQLEEYVMKKLGLSEEAYRGLLESPPVSYKKYPNDEWLMRKYHKLKKTSI
jgi:N-acetyl sugar amidotransferase